MLKEEHSGTALPLHYRVSGEQGSWVFLVHGLFGAGDNLGALARALAESFRVVQLDLRNHGRSPHADSMSFDDLAIDLAALQDRLGIASAHWVGHSLGGRACMQLALREPARVQSLVVADIAPVAYAPHHTEILSALQSLDLATVVNRGQAEAVLATAIPEVGVRQFLLKSLYKEGEQWRWRFNLPALAANYPQITLAQNGTPYGGPALFVRGGDSNYVIAAYEPAIQQLFPQAVIKTIAGAGHWLHGEKPEQFNALVGDFLLGHEA